MRYVRTDSLPEEARDALFGWSKDPFQSKASGIAWRPKDHHITMYDGDRAVSHVGLVRAAVSVGGTPLEVGGLGQVVTVPEFQGRGLARKCIVEAVRVLVDEWKLNYGMLFCFSRLKPFYEDLGWRARTGRVWVQQPQGRVMFPVFSMVEQWGGNWPPGDIEISGFPW
jgi:GNAT superfamily N-acetyltransferase